MEDTRRSTDIFYHTEWIPITKNVPSSAVTISPRFVILSEGTIGGKLADTLRAKGFTSSVVSKSENFSHPAPFEYQSSMAEIKKVLDSLSSVMPVRVFISFVVEGRPVDICSYVVSRPGNSSGFFVCHSIYPSARPDRATVSCMVCYS